MKIKLLGLLLLTSASLQAAGGAPSGSPLDLKWPALNFLLLFSFLVWKLKKPLAEMFDKQAEDVASLYELAEKKDKEAQIKLDMYKEKLNNLEGERKKVLADAEKDAKDFANKTQNETQDYINRITKDVENKIAHEKKTLINELNASLVDEVIKKAKEAISSNEDNKKKATSKLVSQIR